MRSQPAVNGHSLPASDNFVYNRAMKRSFIVGLFLAGLATPGAAGDINGQPRVIDGDTIEVGVAKVRLFGIDAPERDQSCQWPDKVVPCGQLATAALTDLVAGADVTCRTIEKDRYGRWVAVCYAGGSDIGRNLVRTGWALAYRRYSNDYADEEIEANAARVGLWRGTFIPPWKWRRQNVRVEVGP